jgi:thymidylate kinase
MVALQAPPRRRLRYNPAMPDTGRGWFFTFEGPEGAGKTTQMARVEAALVARGFAVTRTREPGGDPVGERVRELLLRRTPETDGEDGAAPLCAEAELLLFAAARAQNVRSVVLPALAAGHLVLCDRFTDSTIAYQGWGRGLPLETIRQVNAFATGGRAPDRTFLLDLPPAQGLARRAQDEMNRLDREELAFHERVRSGFLALAEAEPERFVVLDASLPEEAVATRLLAAVGEAMGISLD